MESKFEEKKRKSFLILEIESKFEKKSEIELELKTGLMGFIQCSAVSHWEPHLQQNIHLDI